MRLDIYDDYEQLSCHAANLICELVRSKPASVLCLASGHTPLDTYRYLAEAAKSGSVDLSQCHFVGLDEWAGIAPEAEGSCRYFLDVYLFNLLNVNPEHIFFFNGTASDLTAECEKMDAVIARLGGLDVMLVGIGMNGHIGMNEPGTPWNLRSHVSQLHETTQVVGQKYFPEKTVLDKGITLGLQYLKEARLPLLMASGEGKAPVVRQALEGEVTETFPASIFQQLPHGVVMLDEAAAALLSRD